MIDEVKSLKARITALEAAQRWTTELPTVEGWYWRRHPPGHLTAYIVHVQQQTTNGPLGIYGPYQPTSGWPFYPLTEDGEWSGPLPEPSAGLPSVSNGAR